MRLTQKVGRKDTFIYNFEYRRVAVDPNSLAISANLIPLLSEPVRVGGPGITWFHDTRTPSRRWMRPRGRTRACRLPGVVEVRVADGLQPDGHHELDVLHVRQAEVCVRAQHAGWIHRRHSGRIRTWGTRPCAVTMTVNLLETNASCNPVPLPERLYAGGATSHRGFPINGAGPRDLQTGYPVGGSAVFINTLELRLPAPTLPVVGNSVSFVIFHDMGNVFQHVGDMFSSIGRFHQPNEQTCEVLTNPERDRDVQLQLLFACDRAGRSVQDAGRADPRGLQLQPESAKYPVITEQTAPGVYVNNILPYVGQGSHFNFFFSIGQSF